MYYINIQMIRVVDKVDMADNNACGKMYNLASEIQINNSILFLATK